MRTRVLRRAMCVFVMAGVFTFSLLGVAPSYAATLIAEQARSADGFVDSIGVNVHLHYDGAYGGPWDGTMEPLLAASGIRHVRDGVMTTDDYYYQRVRTLAAAGIHMDLVIGANTSWGGKATDFTQLENVYRWSNGAIDSFEGINEPNINGITDWVNTTKAEQHQLYQTVKNSALLNHIPVLGPSPVLGGAVQLGNISADMDYGNAHPYPGGQCPTCGDVYGQTLDTYMKEYTTPSGNKPLVMTETGYTNAVNAGPNGNRPASERAAGKYAPRLYFEFFNRGFPRTYMYEFLDNYADPGKANPESDFGLVRFDGTPKPAYTAIKNTIALLQDPGAAFTPGSLSYSLSGNLDHVHHTLLQKRDGTFYLALWLEKSDYDTGARANAPDVLSARGDVTVPDQQVTLTLGQPFAAATTYEPNISTAPLQQIAAPTTMTLSVPDQVLLVKLAPRGSAATATKAVTATAAATTTSGAISSVNTSTSATNGGTGAKHTNGNNAMPWLLGVNLALFTAGGGLFLLLWWRRNRADAAAVGQTTIGERDARGDPRDDAFTSEWAHDDTWNQPSESPNPPPPSASWNDQQWPSPRPDQRKWDTHPDWQ